MIRHRRAFGRARRSTGPPCPPTITTTTRTSTKPGRRSSPSRAGRFRMGSVDARAYWADGEGPIPVVELSPFLTDAGALRAERLRPAQHDRQRVGVVRRLVRPGRLPPRPDPGPSADQGRALGPAGGQQRGCTRPPMRSTGCRPGSGDSSTASSALTATPPRVAARVRIPLGLLEKFRQMAFFLQAVRRRRVSCPST